MEEFLGACFWSGWEWRSGVGGGEENDESHFCWQCWCCGLGEISGGVLGGGLGLTGRRGNGLAERRGMEIVESFIARKTYQL